VNPASRTLKVQVQAPEAAEEVSDLKTIIAKKGGGPERTPSRQERAPQWDSVPGPNRTSVPDQGAGNCLPMDPVVPKKGMYRG
jgi:hypothetical protein